MIHSNLTFFDQITDLWFAEKVVISGLIGNQHLVNIPQSTLADYILLFQTCPLIVTHNAAHNLLRYSGLRLSDVTAEARVPISVFFCLSVTVSWE